ncbi:oqxB_1_EU370913 [Klebsiella pneumoniae]|nr:oqxB_1_EU370913 [Klebsiella pneumoniae]
MIEWIIRRSVANRFLVMMAALFLSIWGTWTIIHTPVDALPDLSDVQVIVKTRYPGQAPQIVENQVTWPLTTTMLSVPGARTVRGFSQFGDSYVYVIFEDGTDPYWARSRVLEYLNQVQGKLPAGVSAEMGPDATGVGWVFEYALVDRSGKHDLAELRSLQDWFLKYELKTIPNVSEVASVGGVVKEYQIVVDPMKLTQYGISLGEVKSALDASNQEAGGSSVELAEAEYMVRASGYLQTLDDFKNIVLKTGDNGVPVYLGDVARVQIGPEMRRGIAELNGEGEVAGGVVILRSGKNAREVISAVKEKLASLQSSLPEGVEVVTTYDRSQLIDRAIDNLSYKLLEEFIVVALVCALFLWHVRSALVAIISLPLGLCFAFIMMHFQGLNANIMSLGGIAIAVGAMVDAAIVMIENAHKRLEEWEHQHPGEKLSNDTLENNYRGLGGGRPGAVYQPADHHPVVYPDFHPRRPGGQTVRPAGLHQNLVDGRGGAAGDRGDPDPDGLLDPRQDPGGEQQSAESLFDPHLSPAAAEGAALAEDYPADCAPVDPDGCLAA